MRPTRKPVANGDDLVKIRDLAADLSSAMDRVSLRDTPIDEASWYAVNRIVRGAGEALARLGRE